MSESAREAQPFHALIRDVESLRVEVLHALRTPDRLDASAQRLRERLEACRAAAATVYTHFEDNGISVGLVFRLRQLRERILRVRVLLDCLLSAQPAVTAAQLMAQLVMVGQSGAACARCWHPTPRCWQPRWPSAAPKRASTTSPAPVPNTAPCCARRQGAVR